MKKLNNQLIEELTGKKIEDYPVKVLQFGEGNFLRGFVDWMIHRTNEAGLFKSRVRVVQPIERGMVDMLNEQDGKYTLISRGLEQGEVVSHSEIIQCIEMGINPYQDYRNYIESADLPELRFIVSNTTEAGISYSNGETLEDQPQGSFPGKITAFLYRRFKTFKGAADKGLVMIPCELIDRNGDNLKRIVFQIAREWKLGEEFMTWLEEYNYFLNTLVDRIVTGYPASEAKELEKELGYADNLIDTAEVFNLWVIEGDVKLAEEFPLKQAGCNVIWTDDMTPYRTRKVRILNGIHTMTCLPAHLYGMVTVGDCLKEETVKSFINKALHEEIISAVDFDKKELTSFSENVLERFANPFIEHKLLSISLNSVSKFKARVLPTILEYLEQKKEAPELLSFSLASLLHFYRGKKADGTEYQVLDDQNVLDTFQALWPKLQAGSISPEDFVKKILGETSFWGTDLSAIPSLFEKVWNHFENIQSQGINKVMESLL